MTNKVKIWKGTRIYEIKLARSPISWVNIKEWHNIHEIVTLLKLPLYFKKINTLAILLKIGKFSDLQYSTAQYSKIQCSTVKYSLVDQVLTQGMCISGMFSMTNYVARNSVVHNKIERCHLGGKKNKIDF